MSHYVGLHLLEPEFDVDRKAAERPPSWAASKNIALAFVPPAMAALGTTIYVEIRGQKAKARVVPTPFYKRAKPTEAQIRNELGSEHMDYPTTYRYTKDDEWIDAKGAAGHDRPHARGPVPAGRHRVSWNCRPSGRPLEAGKPLGVVESVKAVFEIYSPVSGEVVEVNGELKDAPEKVNSDPHGAGWLVKVRLKNPAEIDALMDAAAYEAYRRTAFEGIFALMRYLPKSPAERDEMLAAIGVKIDRRPVFEHSRALPPAGSPEAAGALLGSGNHPVLQGARQGEFGRLHELSGSGRVQPPALGGYRHDHSARRVPDFLHALSGGNLPGHAPGDLRVSDADVPAHRTRSRQRFDVGWLNGHDGSRADGREDHSPSARSCGPFPAPGISRGAEDLREELRLESRRFPLVEDGTLDQKALESAIRDDVAAVVVQSPNFFGVIEHSRRRSRTARTRAERFWSLP